MRWLKRFWNWSEEPYWDKRHFNPYPLANIYTGRIIIGIVVLLVVVLVALWIESYL